MTYKTSRTLCILSLAIALVALVFSCKKDEDPNIQSITFEREYFQYSPTSVTVSGVYSYDGRIDGIKMQVGKRNDLADARAFEADIDGRDYTVEITGLQPGTEYHYCYEVDYGFSKPYKTETKTFATPADSPVVKTLEVMALDSTTVRVKCEVVAEGGQEVTERGICWNTYGDPTLDDETMQHASVGVGQYTLRVEGLSFSTKYYFRAYAKNASGVGFGEVLEFETMAEAHLPEVSTVEIINITSTTATCMGNVASNGGLELTGRGVCWSLSANPSLTDSHAAASDATLGVFQVAMTGFTPNKTYHARAYATNAKGTAYGADLTFTTTEGLPVVTTTGITEITATSAKGGGVVTDQGASNVTERGICWGTSHNPTTSGTHANSGTGAGSFTVSMTNLTPNATYYVRAYAINAQGTAYGAEVSFKALEGLPVVLTLDITDITSTTAKGHGKVTNQGGSTVTERGICWSKEPSPNINGSHASSGTGAGEYTVSLSNLTPGTRYYVRAYATNTQGTTYGEQKDFTTAATLPTVVTGNISGTTVYGNVTSNGGATVTERGVCWSTSHNPTTAGTHGSSGTGTGGFSVELTDLEPGTTYYVRAYATNSAGTAYGSEKTLTTQATLPTVTTSQVTNVTQTTATGGGNVTNAGGGTVTARGVCWSTSHNPTTSSNHTTDGSGTGSFTSNMTNLTPNTTYYVRAYATNSAGTAYGSELSFTTSTPSQAPTGAINGLFSVSATQQVWFSQGNLQYNMTTQVWSFMEHQYDMVEISGQDVGENYANQNIVSLFGWGTSGYNHGAVCYQPWSTSTRWDYYLAYGSDTYNLYDQTGQADWGYNSISNGGNQTNQWRTLTKDEWVYVFDTRSTSSGIRYAKAEVNDVGGVILLPDNWSASYYTLSNTNTEYGSFTSNIITSSQWNILEQHGAVFLPAAGYRYGTSAGTKLGYYWSASKSENGGPYSMDFSFNHVCLGYGAGSGGFSVRLVRVAQ